MRDKRVNCEDCGGLFVISPDYLAWVRAAPNRPCLCHDCLLKRRGRVKEKAENEAPADELDDIQKREEAYLALHLPVITDEENDEELIKQAERLRHDFFMDAKVLRVAQALQEAPKAFKALTPNEQVELLLAAQDAGLEDDYAAMYALTTAVDREWFSADNPPPLSSNVKWFVLGLESFLEEDDAISITSQMTYGLMPDYFMDEFNPM